MSKSYDDALQAVATSYLADLTLDAKANPAFGVNMWVACFYANGSLRGHGVITRLEWCDEFECYVHDVELFDGSVIYMQRNRNMERFYMPRATMAKFLKNRTIDGGL